MTERMKDRIEIRKNEARENSLSLARRLAEKAEYYEANCMDNIFAEMAAEQMDKNIKEYGMAW